MARAEILVSAWIPITNAPTELVVEAAYVNPKMECPAPMRGRASPGFVSMACVVLRLVMVRAKHVRLRRKAAEATAFVVPQVLGRILTTIARSHVMERVRVMQLRMVLHVRSEANA